MRYSKKMIFLASALLAVSTAADAQPDSTMVIEAGAEGKVFRKMTVEGEDRFRIDFERPHLKVRLDPSRAPGLDWDNTWDVVSEGDIDLREPLAAMSATWSSPYLPRPWLDGYASDDIVIFQPSLTGVEHWKLTIADSRSGEVRSFEGDDDPPDRIGWNGLSFEGRPMEPGYTYSYVVEAWDRAGNKRNFVGKGFKLPSYRLIMNDMMVFLFTGDNLGSGSSSTGTASGTPNPLLLEAASRINQANPAGSRIEVAVAARSYDQADAMAGEVVRSLSDLLIGDPSRIKHVTDIKEDAPEEGTVMILMKKAE